MRAEIPFRDHLRGDVRQTHPAEHILQMLHIRLQVTFRRAPQRGPVRFAMRVDVPVGQLVELHEGSAGTPGTRGGVHPFLYAAPMQIDKHLLAVKPGLRILRGPEGTLHTPRGIQRRRVASEPGTYASIGSFPCDHCAESAAPIRFHPHLLPGIPIQDQTRNPWNSAPELEPIITRSGEASSPILSVRAYYPSLS